MSTIKKSLGTTPVPNVLFDVHLKELKPAALKLLLIVIRQTWGWQERGTKNRKQRDWMSSSQLTKKTGCSRRALTDAIEILTQQKLLETTDESGMVLHSAKKRRGQTKLYYRFCGEKTSHACANTSQKPEKNMLTTKETLNKSISEKSQDKRKRFSQADLEQFSRELKQAGSIEQLLKEKHAIKFVDGHRVIITNDQPERYKHLFLSGYDFSGVKIEALRTPYALLMELYHHYQQLQHTTK